MSCPSRKAGAVELDLLTVMWVYKGLEAVGEVEDF